MAKKTDTKKIERKINEALKILEALGFPRQQQNERSAMTLLSLLNLKPSDVWEASSAPLVGITPMMEFFADHYGKRYKPNTRETVRRQTVHQFAQAGLIVPNPDKPSRPTNSPKAVYQIEPSALKLLRAFGKPDWDRQLRKYLRTVETLKKSYARERDMRRLPVRLSHGQEIRLSPGGQNVLVKAIIDEFCPLFTPGGHVIYVGDTQRKWAYFDLDAIKGLHVEIEEHGKMPDVVVYHVNKNWLVLIEAVTSHGPVNPKRRRELKELFAGSRAAPVYVTAFLDRRTMMKYLDDISWETEVWIAESPTHLIHFNGERFLGPYGD
ncbi:MAG: BsuBI/PstI family type II restriction endonuclease [bacterium]